MIWRYHHFKNLLISAFHWLSQHFKHSWRISIRRHPHFLILIPPLWGHFSHFEGEMAITPRDPIPFPVWLGLRPKSTFSSIGAFTYHQKQGWLDQRDINHVKKIMLASCSNYVSIIFCTNPPFCSMIFPFKPLFIEFEDSQSPRLRTCLRVTNTTISILYTY